MYVLPCQVLLLMSAHYKLHWKNDKILVYINTTQFSYFHYCIMLKIHPLLEALHQWSGQSRRFNKVDFHGWVTTSPYRGRHPIPQPSAGLTHSLKRRATSGASLIFQMYYNGQTRIQLVNFCLIKNSNKSCTNTCPYITTPPQFKYPATTLRGLR